jgi:hypothetical protein
MALFMVKTNLVLMASALALGCTNPRIGNERNSYNRDSPIIQSISGNLNGSGRYVNIKKKDGTQITYFDIEGNGTLDILSFTRGDFKRVYLKTDPYGSRILIEAQQTYQRLIKKE